MESFRRLRRLNAVLTSSSPLSRRLWRLNKELDRSLHTDQSDCVCLIGAQRGSAPHYQDTGRGMDNR